MVRRLRHEGPYTPFGLTPSLSMPGTMGGGNWGGVAFDPELGYIFVNTSSLGGTGHMVPAPVGAPMPYRNDGGYTRFIDEDQYPCQQPPWGELSAVNANTGEIVWRRPLGSYDQVEAQGLKNAGAPNMGGSIVTAGGLVFIAATTDSKFRAFDSRTGKELWMARLEATGDAVPMTYLGRDNKQYVVIAAGGTNRFRMLANTGGTTADSLIAFSLSGSQAVPTVLQTRRALNSPAQSAANRGSLAQKVPEVSAALLPEEKGKAVVVRVCTSCHGAAVFAALEMNRSRWTSEVASTVDKGAVATEDERRIIVDYLARNFKQR